jgi:hypothetical protein
MMRQSGEYGSFSAGFLSRWGVEAEFSERGARIRPTQQNPKVKLITMTSAAMSRDPLIAGGVSAG